ncbi:VWA domain-containing protein [Rhizobiaceae bacterium n13]|uniref:VWA domain-containing protein n=1 Tax=Ferirhizobium litorale TaxID=2927786 RepID=A0AAE3U1M5_9HYPH|nr:VWA domain-containing protein [Fererhizobium litorale]MDI7863109.1 VWA domain-containing protein [Fererhizobium litorale]MDI7923214.1 VWA domain-containing protein [Fererhizobium litorale]
MIADFHFLRPWWLLAVIAAALLVWQLGRQSDMRARWRNLIAPNLLDHLLIDRGRTGGLRPVHLIGAILALSGIAAAGPTWERERPPFVEDTAPLAIAIDLGQTMNATDISPSRVERAKLKVQDILARRQGARTALFAYAGSAHMVLPLTDDAQLVATYLAALSPALMPIEGKDTAKALEAVEAALADETVPGTILFMTDGVERGAFPAFTGYGGRNDLMVLGMGTPEGGPVRTGSGEYLTDSTGARVQARLDVDALKELQSSSSAQVATVTLDDGDVDWIVRRIQTAFAQKSEEGLTRWRDFGWYLTIPIALLTALTFRRGAKIHWLGLAVLVVSLGGTIRAEAADFADLWRTPDQQGRRAFERGDYAAAADQFAEPAWRGAALYRAGRFQDAIDAFAQSNTAESYYNQGNALMHLDKPEEAIAAYQQALKARPDWTEAKANLALAERRKKENDEKEEEEQQEQAGLDPDQIQFDDKGKRGKEGEVPAGAQTAEMWMRNIQVSPADLLARKFAIEARTNE